MSMCLTEGCPVPSRKQDQDVCSGSRGSAAGARARPSGVELLLPRVCSRKACVQEAEGENESLLSEADAHPYSPHISSKTAQAPSTLTPTLAGASGLFKNCCEGV